MTIISSSCNSNLKIKAKGHVLFMIGVKVAEWRKREKQSYKQ